MSKKKKLLVLILLLVLMFLSFMAWYQYTYSMDETASFEINTISNDKKIVIATQGSAFKNKITSNIINHYKNDSIYIKVIDIDGLSKIYPKNYDAIILIHTWESWQPPQAVKLFLNRTRLKQKKIIILTTSGSGGAKMEGVDALTGESILENSNTYSNQIIKKLEPLLNK